MCSLLKRAACPSYWNFELNLPRRRRGQIPAKEMGGSGVEVRTLDRASFWSRGSSKAEFAGKSQSHDEYEYGSRVPGLVEVVVCDVRKLQEVDCA